MKTTELRKKISKLSTNQLSIYQLENKKTSAFVLFALFLGGFGAQWFYIRKTWAGILSVIFCWLLIPSIISVCVLPFSSRIINNFNSKIIDELSVTN